MYMSKKFEFHLLSIAQSLNILKSHKTGLSFDGAKQRLKECGSNELPQSEKENTGLHILGEQFASPLIIILLIAGGISLALKEFVDGLVIGITVALNVCVGFIQEYHANQALKKLRNMVTYNAVVVREGNTIQIPSKEIVPGDRMLLNSGDKIQADGRIIEVSECEVNEAVLTGESEPQKKIASTITHIRVPLGDRINMVYRGTVVSKGRAVVLVTNTGKNTEIGKIAVLVKDTEAEITPLQAQIEKLGKVLGMVVLLMCICILIIGLSSSNTHIESNLELFKTAVAVAVAAIPEGLAISMTVILAIGMQRILRRNALVRKLLAAETLGSVSVICTDKTGTLTEGNMSVNRIVTADTLLGADDLHENSKDISKTDARFAIELAVLCNDGIIHVAEEKGGELEFSGNMTDIACIRYGVRIGLIKSELDHVYRRIADIPFDSKKKYMAVYVANGASHFIGVKGAPERLYHRVSFIRESGEIRAWTNQDLNYFKAKERALTRQGLRVIAVAYAPTKSTKTTLSENDIHKLIFVGLIAIVDPLRPDVKETVQKAQAAGIEVLLMTGDHARTAESIACEAGIGTCDKKDVCEGSELDALNDKDLQKKLKQTSIFARVDPSHKIRLVKALQAQGHVVAMTGDGVNDAPALKGADIGVAVGSGTDVAKEIADIVLLNNSFTTIVDAIEEGRRIYQNIKKVVLYLLSSSFSEVVLIIVSIILGLPLPVLPAQILWVNLIQDSFPVMALAFDPGDAENMRERPRKRTESIFDRKMKLFVTLKTIFTNILLFGIFFYYWRTTGDIAFTRTIIFLAFAVDALFYIFPIRSLVRPLTQIPWFDNIYLTCAVGFGWGMLLLAIYFPPFQLLLHTVPLGAGEWLVLLIFGIVNVFFVEMLKWILRKKK